jgi:FkbM family methyltransferase
VCFEQVGDRDLNCQMRSLDIAFQGAVRGGVILNRMLRPLGIKFSRRLPPLRDVPNVVERLLFKRDDASVIDVGAADGEFAATVLKIVPRAEVLCVEPIPRNLSVLTGRFRGFNVEVVQAAAGALDGEVTFHETAHPDCSSILTPAARCNVEFPKVTNEAAVYKVPMKRLDTIVSGRAIGGEKIDLLKVDTQGSELLVLKGAEQTLPKCKHVLLEISFLPLYEGQASFEEVMMFLFSRGFRLVDYVEGARSHVTRELMQMDLLYRALAP